MNKKIIVKNSNQSYSILIGDTLFDDIHWLPKKNFSRIVIITDHCVKKYYGISLQNALNQLGYSTLLFSFPSGEKSKNNKTKQIIENKMQRHHCDKNSLILALGGGVVGDLAGFIAATFLRGVAYMQIPTTVLSMVDSSVGGKTGINTQYGKNLIGVIYQPLGVVMDVAVLNTLSIKNKINGLIEAIKIFLTHDKKSFFYLEKHLDQILEGNQKLLQKIIIRAIKIKIAIVGRDEKDFSERNCLNLGHTIGHALEKLSHYKMMHGYAVAYGLLMESTIAYLYGFLSEMEWLKIKKLLAHLHIHGKYLKKYPITQLIKATRQDKKMHLGQVRYVLLQKIGQTYVKKNAYVHAVTDQWIKKAFKLVTEA